MLKSYTHSSRLVAIPSEYSLNTAPSSSTRFASLVSRFANGSSFSKSLLDWLSQSLRLSGVIVSNSMPSKPALPR